jgi:hypothetical protein
MVGAITEVVADDLDFAHPSGIAFRRTCAVSRLGIGRFSLGRNSDTSGLDMLRATVGIDALSPVLDCDAAARGQQLRALGLAVGDLGRDELGLSSW